MKFRKLPKIVVEKIRARKFFRDVVMSVIGTTISIALTFGTAEMKNAQKKKKDGRATVMMVVHDIDESVRILREQASLEESNREVTQYVMSQINQPDSLSDDTIRVVLDYMLQGAPFDIDSSNEKIFQSSQDTWKNISNKGVIDLIQEFYRHRRSIIDEINSNLVFVEPISREMEYKMLLNSPEHYVNGSNAAKELMEVLKSDEGDLFISYSPSRQRYYSTVADSWQRVSDQCKFMMSITDDEMAAYIANSKRTGSNIARKQLIGKWLLTSTSASNLETLEFLRDNTFVHTKFNEYTSTEFSGRMKIVRTMPGTWEIKDDSIVRHYTIGEHWDADFSEVTYTDEMAETVKKMIDEWQQQIDSYNETAKTESLGRRANLAYIDKSGNKIELHTYDDTDAEITQYIVREKEE